MGIYDTIKAAVSDALAVDQKRVSPDRLRELELQRSTSYRSGLSLAYWLLDRQFSSRDLEEVAYVDPFVAIAQPEMVNDLRGILSKRVVNDEESQDNNGRTEGNIEFEGASLPDVKQAFANEFGIGIGLSTGRFKSSMKKFIELSMRADCESRHQRTVAVSRQNRSQSFRKIFWREKVSNWQAWRSRPYFSISYDLNLLFTAYACFWYRSQAAAARSMKKKSIIERLAGFLVSVCYFLSDIFFNILSVLTMGWIDIRFGLPNKKFESCFIVNDVVIESMFQGHSSYGNGETCSAGFSRRVKDLMKSQGFIAQSAQSNWLEAVGVSRSEHGGVPLFSELLQQAVPFDGNSIFDVVKYADSLIHQAQVAKRNGHDSFACSNVLQKGMGDLMQQMGADGAVSDSAHRAFCNVVYQLFSTKSTPSSISDSVISSELVRVFNLRDKLKIKIKMPAVENLSSLAAFGEWLALLSKAERQVVKINIAVFHFQLQDVNDKNMSEKIWSAAGKNCLTTAKADQVSRVITAAEAQGVLGLSDVSSLRNVCAPNCGANRPKDLIADSLWRNMGSRHNGAAKIKHGVLASLISQNEQLETCCLGYAYSNTAPEGVADKVLKLTCQTDGVVNEMSRRGRRGISADYVNGYRQPSSYLSRRLPRPWD